MTTAAAGGAAQSDLSDGLRLGVGTFTRLRVTPPEVVDVASGRVAILTAPIWGLVVGAIAGGATGALWWWFTHDGSAPALAAGLCAVVGLATSAWLSRGLHLDGLADTFDGFASMRHGHDAMDVMRDPHLGALGAVGLVMTLLLQVGALAIVVSAASAWAVVAVLAAVGIISRGVLPWVVRTGTPAADRGLGAIVVGSVPVSQAIAATALSSLIAAALLATSGFGVVAASLAVVAAVAASLGLRRSALRRFGVLSGDPLGAAIELATTGVLLVVAAAS